MHIPTSYAAWRRCIEVDCGLELSPAMIRDRISALENPRDFRTRQFLEFYGDAHLAQVIAWFRRAQQEIIH